MPLLCAVVLADEPPSDVPVYYYGWALVNGTLAQDGTAVTAESDGVVIGSATTPSGYTSGSGYYHIYINSSYSGQAVALKVRGVTATTLTLPERGRAGLLNLSVNVSVQPQANGAGSSQGGGSATASASESNMTIGGFMQAGSTKTLNFTADVIVIAISFKAKENISSGEIAVKRESGKPEGLPVPDGVTYGYLSIASGGLPAEDIRIQLSVNKSWIAGNGVNASTVSISRYASGWQKLPTKLAGESADGYMYEASIPGFSYFVVTGEKAAACQNGAAECLGDQLRRCEGGAWLAQDCAHGCSQALSACNGPCAEGESRCSTGGASEKCVNGTWKTESCASGCINDACASQGVPYTAYALAALAVLAAVFIIVRFVK